MHAYDSIEDFKNVKSLFSGIFNQKTAMIGYCKQIPKDIRDIIFQDLILEDKPSQLEIEDWFENSMDLETLLLSKSNSITLG